MNRIALHSSSFVGQRCGYHPPHTWMECVKALSGYYRPLETFPERFEALLLQVKALGFDAMDVWQPAILNWQWATDEHIQAARSLLERHQIAVTSLAGEFGKTPDEFRASCRLAKGIAAPILSGLTELLFSQRTAVISILKEYDLKLALENHPETSAQQMLDEIGDGAQGRIGTAVDTGWYATRGYDVVKAIHELGDRILHIHLKDVLPGDEHINCGYGQGIVPLEACVQALKQSGYAGDYSVEEHALDHDPSAEVKEAGRLVKKWLNMRHATSQI
jgi:L-ribulose-5-phosphate 3-epimerase